MSRSQTDVKLEMTLDELAERQYGPPWAEQRPERWRPYPSNSHHQDAARRSNEGNVCYVNSNVDVNRTAGFVAHGVRESSTFMVLPSGWDSLWTALKVISLARSYLQPDNLDFSFELVDTEDWDDRFQAELALELSIDTDGWLSASEKEIRQESPVSAQSEPHKVAGHVAKLSREDADCLISLSGPDAAAQGIEALRLAKSYLQEDGRDLVFAAKFGSSEHLRTIVYISVFRSFKKCRVNSHSDPHSIAGYLAQGVRDGRPPCVCAIGSSNLNLAVKAVAIARSFLEEEQLDIACRVDFPEYYYNSETMKMKMLLATIHGSSVRRMTSSKVSEPLYVSANTRVQKVAGALAQRVRANQQAFCAAMGPVAVAISLKCVYLANRFLLEDSMRIRMSPEFANSDQGGSLLCLHVLPELWV